MTVSTEDDSLNACALMTWAGPCQGAQCLRPMGIGRAFPGVRLRGTMVKLPSDPSTNVGRNLSPFLPDNCSLKLIPLQRPPTKTSYLLLLVLYIMKMLTSWVVMVQLQQSMSHLRSSRHVSLCLSFSQSLAASSVRSRPSLTFCDTEVVNTVYYVAYPRQCPDAAKTKSERVSKG